MNLMDMTLGEFYEKAQAAVSDLTAVNTLSLQTFNQIAENDLKDAGLLEYPIFLRNGTIYFGIKNLYPENEPAHQTDSEFDIECELGTIHASYKDEYYFRTNSNKIPLCAKITQISDYPANTLLSDLEHKFRLAAANSEKKRIQKEIKEMMTKLSDYKDKVSILNEVIANNGSIL